MTNTSYFITDSEDGFGSCLVLQQMWSNDFVDLIKKENISVLRLSESAGWKGKDISFLEQLQGTDLRGVEVYAWDVKDLTPLQYLPRLETIGLQAEFTKAPDFSTFNNLTHLFLYWRPKAITVFGCSGLQRLNIVNYPLEDLKKLNNIAGLKHLQLTSKKLLSLAGIEALQSLRNLDLAICPKLESLSGINKCQEIQFVELESCKKVSDVSSLGELSSLREIVLTDCGKIKSLQSLAKCRLLESLIFAGDTNVEDGELTPLLDMPELKRMWFADKRHYSHKRAQVEAILS